MVSAEVQSFFGTLRTGGSQEIAVLLQDLEPWLRRIIRLRLVDGRLRRVMDTTDVFHSLVEDFLRRQETGVSPEAGASTTLRAYLAAAVLHKIQTRARKERRHAGSLADDFPLIGAAEHVAGNQVEARDYLGEVRRRLGVETRHLLDLNLQGFSWNEIAGDTGGKPDALRMRMRRELTKVLSELADQESRNA